MVTRKDIAQRAGVSVSVVSRALNNSGYVEEEKKRKILMIAEQMGYHPNPVAMSLMTQRTKQILFYCRELENAFNIEVYEGMLEVAKKHDYMVVVHGKLDFKSVRSIMVDGLILPSEKITDVYLKGAGKNYNLPVVSASYGDSISFVKSVPVVECDLWEGTRMILQYLWDRGHRKIAMIMPYELENSNARTCAYKEFMQYELGEKIQDNITIPEDFFGKGMLAAEIFRERKCDATAALCFNDDMALGFYRGLKKLGYGIPEDVSIVGIDGIYARKYADLFLTSLKLNPRMQGARCMEVLLDVLQGKKVKYVTRIPLCVEEGESVRTIER